MLPLLCVTDGTRVDSCLLRGIRSLLAFYLRLLILSVVDFGAPLPGIFHRYFDLRPIAVILLDHLLVF